MGAWILVWALVCFTSLVLGVLAIVWLIRNLTGQSHWDGDPA
jgi:hypothetical protein